jgi:Ca-activated chloride channel family protein
MPIEGDRADLALELAETELARSETPGALLFVLDDLNPANVNRFNENAESRPPVIFFVVAGQGVQIPQIEQVENATIVNISPDDSDLDRIERRVLSAYREALLEDTNQEWEDRGYILAWPAAVLLLFWFRRGWTLLSVVALMLTVPFGRPAQADGWRDWFLTPDQQGQIAIRNKDYSEAADLFDNSEWRAFALLRAGRYEEAAQAYGFIETAAAANAQGIALLRNRKYRDGVRAFEKALERDPTDAAALANLEVARAIVAFVETTQAASDTGEEGIGADDTVYDNESGLGEEMLVERPEEDGLPAGLSTEDWMRSIDTQVGDFLASRFRLEVARDAQ